MTANIENGKVVQVFYGKGGSHKVTVNDESDYFINFATSKYINRISHREVLASLNESDIIIENEDDEDTVF